MTRILIADASTTSGSDPTGFDPAREMLLLAALKHVEWIDEEKRGPDYNGMTRDTHPDGEFIWRKWWDRQLDLCAETEVLCRSAIAMEARAGTASPKGGEQ